MNYSSKFLGLPYRKISLKPRGDTIQVTGSKVHWPAKKMNSSVFPCFSPSALRDVPIFSWFHPKSSGAAPIARPFRWFFPLKPEIFQDQASVLLQYLVSRMACPGGFKENALAKATFGVFSWLQNANSGVC